MDKNEKIMLTNNFINNVKKSIINLINKDKLPKDWDGIELREFIADKFDRERFFGLSYSKELSKKSRRYKVYKYVLRNKIFG